MGKSESAVAESNEDAAAPSPRRRVFIVDDELAILDIISRGLTKAGFETSTFISGREFERAVAREAPDFCIIDLSIPDLDGVALVGELAAQSYHGRILFISGHSAQLLRTVVRLAEESKLQIIGCVRKPFTIAPLIEALSASPVTGFAPTSEGVLRAIGNEEIIVHFQPIVNLPLRRVIAAEALVRWQHPIEGLLPPARFLSKIDQHSMNELSAHVLRSVFQVRAQWARESIGIELAINVPTSTIVDRGFGAEIGRLMDRYNCGLDGITFEITENEMVEDIRALANTLSGLCLKGARISVDDFGTGFSSLSRLQCLPIDEVKIDKSFIRHSVTHIEDRKIAEAVIALAHALDMSVTAEGVETEATALLLTELGCDRGQGFLFGRPVSSSELYGLIVR